MDVLEPTRLSDQEPDKPRVLFVSHETTLSGAPIQLAHLLSWLKQSGWKPVVIAPEDGPLADIIREQQIELILDSQLLSDAAYGALRNQAQKFDVVVANTITTWGAVRAAHLENVPVVWCLHETLVGLRLMERIAMIQPTLALADTLVVPTETTAQIYQPFARWPVEVIPYGIPELKLIDHVASDAVTFLVLATYEIRKGQDIFVDALGRLDPQIRSRARFQMAGRPLETPFYEQLCRKAAALPELQILGPLSHDGSIELLAKCDVVVCPSRDETMPIVLLEAMSLGKAVISADVGGICEWLRDEENALLVPPEDPAALAQAIQRLVRDVPLRAALCAAARKTFATHFIIDRFGEHFARVIDKTIERKRTGAGLSKTYQTWIELYDTIRPAGRRILQRQVAKLRRPALISILLPVFNPDLGWLKSAIESVKQQIHRNWELCIADDASTDPAVRPFLEKEAASDSRIKLTFRPRNGNISACSNSALQIVTGEWCALLDQDDELTENALALVALEIDAHPDAGLIYSDEDFLDLAGHRSNPFFKTDWNPERFLAQNYLNHLGVYRVDLLRVIGGFREGLEGSQDYDLALRCIERLRPEQIRHIPHILYRWRMVPGSLAEVRDAKPYAKEAARRGIADHLRRLGILARVEPCPENIESHRVVYDLPEPVPVVTLISVAGQSAALGMWQDKIRRATDYIAFEFVEAEILDRVNELAKCANGSLLLVCRPDVQPSNRGWLREMVSHALRPDVGVVGARIWSLSGTLEDGGLIMGLGGIAGTAHRGVPRGHAGFFNSIFLQRDCSAVSLACFAVRRDVFLELDGFDTKNLETNFHDADLCLRARERGLRVIWTPYADLVQNNLDDADTRRQVTFRRDADYMVRRWGNKLQHDPFYSPNLSLRPPGFGLAFPPRLSPPTWR